MSKLINNRYHVVEQLGTGGMGTVYLVQDPQRANQTLTLKMIRTDLIDERSLAQFKYEFTALAQLSHPNLVAVYDFGVIPDTRDYFYTMEYVPGEDLPNVAQRYAEQASGEYGWLYEIVVQICRALQYIHSRGFIHYDVKPRNIRLMPDGNVKLMDFGLIGEARGAGQQRVRGTPEYVAPELVRGDPVDQRADLYSLGISLYEAVTGRLPFTGESSMQILRQHVEERPLPPRRLVEGLPSALQDLILKLMAKEPVNRYSSANAVIQAINELTGLDFPVETKETKLGYIQSGNFVGREFELARLQGLLMRMVQGQGRLMLITGAAGVGKSRLVRELRLRAQMQRVLVFEGVCYEHARYPYRPWVSIFSQLLTHRLADQTDPPPTWWHGLARLMPELAGYLGPAAAVETGPVDKMLLMDTASRFLTTFEQPLLLVLEDLHFADNETVELLAYIAQRAPQGRILLCGLYRDEEIGVSHPLGAVVRQARAISRRSETRTSSSMSGDRPYELLRLEPLTEEDVSDFIGSMLGVRDLPGGLLTRAMAETGGNPLFIESLMHSLVDEDLLSYDGETWAIDLERLTQIPASIQAAAKRRLERLNLESLDLLQWAAVLGHWVDLTLLAAVVNRPPEYVYGVVARAAQQHVLAQGEQAGQTTYRFSDDQMREAIYSTLPAGERAQRHQHVGNVLRGFQEEREIAELLAWHFERAGDLSQALAYSQLAADRARAIYAIESAVRLYTQALAFVQNHPELADPEQEYAILAGRAEEYQLMGEREKEKADLDAMSRLAEQLNDIPRLIQVSTRRVTLANQLGNQVEAQQTAETALALARQIGDRQLEAESLTALGLVIMAQSEYATAQQHYEAALEIYHALGHEEGIAQCCWRLGNILRRTGQSAQSYFEQALHIYRKIGDRKGESDTLNALGVAAIDYAERRAYYEQSLVISQAIGDRTGQSRCYNNLALVYWSLGLYGRARDYMEQAVQIQRELQGRTALAYYLESMGRVYFELGEYQQALQCFEEGRALTMDIGERINEALYWLGIGRVMRARGRLHEARDLLQMACDILRELDAMTHLPTTLAWLGIIYLDLGDWEQAYRHTAEALVGLDAVGGYVMDYPAQDILWLHYQVLKARRAHLGTDVLDDESWACLQRTRQVMLDGIATLSDEGLRRNYLNKVQINRDIIAEWTRYAVTRAEEGTAEQLQILAEVERATGETQLEDKLKRVLDISVQMNETHRAEELLDYVMDQVIELSGAERGFLVLLDETGRMDFRVARGMDAAEIERAKAQVSYTVLGAVMQTRQAVLLQDAMTDERFGRQSSVLELNLRSVLCVPLVAGSELVGLIYTDNRSVSGRFSQGDVDLMTIFANQAASAIENARLYEQTIRANQELEAWAYTLEQRVAERTAELRQANVALSRRAVQLETSSRVAQQVTSILDLDALLQVVVQLLQTRFGYYFVGVWMLDPQQQYIELRAGTGATGEQLRQQGFRLALDVPSIVAGVCKSGEPRVVDDARAAPDYLWLDTLPNAQSEVVLPLRMGATLYGALSITSDRPADFSAEDLMVLQTLAGQISVTIRNAQLYEIEQAGRRLAETLEQVGRALSSSLDLREVPARILEQLAYVLPYGRGLFLVREGGILRSIAQRGFPADYQVADISFPIRQGDVFREIVDSGSPLLIEDVASDARFQQSPDLETHRSWMGLPLISKDQVMGMLSLTRPQAGVFTSDDASIAQAFAGQASIALENARLYDEITRFNEQLEEMVAQRTEELNKAYQTLERLDKTKSDFIGVSAHELRTPLTVIRGYTQFLKSYPTIKADTEIQAMLGGMLAGVDRLHNIVNRMLDVARIDTQTLEMAKETTNLANILENLYIEFRADLQQRNLGLTLEDSLRELPLLQVDRSLIQKVFYHLYSNAIKYTPDGGRIMVGGQVMHGDDQKPLVQITVSDTGIGIDREHQALIFEKFYQTGQIEFHSSGDTKFKGGGPGLGLAIARGIVEAHGGRIWAESECYSEDACPGSRFYVLLPVE